MKRNRRIFLLLAASAAMALTGCDNSAAQSGSSSQTQEEAAHHRFQATPTSHSLIKNGKTNYKIVMSSEENEQLLYARNELTSLFLEATGIELGVLRDTNLSYASTDTYISLGKNAYFASAGLEETTWEDYGRDGVRILTKGQSIFIYGESDYATLYGVYDFLSLAFHFETYYENCYALDKNVKDAPLCDYDVIDIPDVAYRQKRGLLFPTAEQNQMFGYRMRVSDSVNDLLLPIYEGDTPGSSYSVNHNSFYYFPKAIYENSHPKFYSQKGDQLCFTARGDQEEWGQMIQLAAKKIEDSLTWHPVAEYPSYTTAFLGMNDINDMCDCSSCTKMKNEHNNSPTAAVIVFMNEVGKRVNAWMELEENAAYKRELNYSFFAYQACITPPFKEKEDGTFEYKDDIIPDDGVKLMPFVASMNFDYGRSFYASANDEARQILKAWGNFYPGTWAWSYGGFYADYLSFYDIYNFYADYHAYLAKYHYSLSFEQVKNDQRGADPGFGGLANYVLSKKSWNASLDMEELIENFMDNVYDSAAPVMKEMLHKLRLWFAKTIEKNGIGNGGSMQADISSNKKYWGFGFVKELFALCEEAYEAIEVYKKDEAKYQRLHSYIDIEWIIPAKVTISCYEDKFTAEEFLQIKKKFKDICLDMGIKDIKEFVSINSFLEGLGV